MALDLVLLGPPGSGKGTQAARLTDKYRIPAIATGDILRAQVEAGTPLGQRVRSYLDRGELVPDQLVVDIIRQRLSQPDTEVGFILDGFPRTLPQAQALDAMLAELQRPLDAVLYLETDRQSLLDRVGLPNMVVTIPLEREEAQAAVAAARQGDGLVLLVPRVEGRFANFGTVAKLEDSRKLPNGIEVAILQGLYRASVGSAAAGTGTALRVLAQPAQDVNPLTETSHVLAREYKALIENLLELRGAGEVIQMVRGIDKPSQLADLAGYSPDLSLERKVEILDTLDVERRLKKLIEWTREILADASLKDKIRNDVQEGMEKRQREFLLRQQMEAIKKELGEGDGDVAAEYRKKIEDAGMPDAVRKEV